MDKQLAFLVRAVNEGEECPPLRVLTGSGIYVGTPIPEEQFWDYSEGELGASHSPRPESPGTAGRYLTTPFERDIAAAEREALAEAGTRGPLGTLHGVPDSGDVSALTLWDTSWRPFHGDGLTLPVVRVPLVAVTGWWIAGGSVAKAGSNWSVGLGVLFPVDG